MEEKNFIETFVSIFDDVDAGGITMETNFRAISEWGSLPALMLLSVVEDEYGVGLNNNELTSAKTVRDLFVLVEGKRK
jgi:acyl carrier protein